MTPQKASREENENIVAYKGNNQVISLSVELARIDPAVKAIEKYAFEDCDRLKYVHFCKGLQEVGSSAFFNCKLLECIRFPSTMKVIYKGAFYNCENLKYAILNEGLESIEEDAFYGCGMELLCIPSTVKYVKTGSFDNCRALKRVALSGELVKVENYAFNRCDKLELIEIPNTSLDDVSATFQPFAVPEFTSIMTMKDVQFWNDLQRRYEQEDFARMEKYGMVVEEDTKVSMNATSKPSPQDEPSKPIEKPRALLEAPAVASGKRKQETREDILQKLADKREQIEWLKKLLASAQNERDELQAKLNECDMPG